MLRVGIDVGGTFTDLFGYDETSGRTVSAKVLTTVHNQAEGVLGSLGAAGLTLADAHFIGHGTTTGLNALIERKGSRTALVTTAGFRDVLEIMRTDRESGYDLGWAKPEAFVPRRLRFEVDERVLADGTVERPLDEDSVRAAIAAALAAGAESIAVCLLHSYANPRHERRVRELIEEAGAAVQVSLSSEVNAEVREFERTNTVVLDAYVKPIMVRYVERLVDELAGGDFAGRLLLMQGSGGMMTPERALQKPISTLSSGPAAGAIAAARIAHAAGFDDIVTFDVGGTSTDVSLVRAGVPYLNVHRQIEWGLPVRVPLIDVESVGAGGGSIGWIDDGGALKMGPRSAGSTPGPVCYGRGGAEPTLSDALLIRGILSDRLAGGTLSLDVEAARAAVQERLAEPLGLPLDRVVNGMVEIAQANMANAVRSVSIWKGLDPRDLTLVAFGGAGGLVAGPVARILRIPRLLIPPVPGNACAMGTLMTDLREDTAVACLARADAVDPALVNERLERLRAATRDALASQGVDPADADMRHVVDLRYRGQIHELRIALDEFPVTAETLRSAVRAFEDAYEETYSIRLADGVPELVSLRVTATGSLPQYDVPLHEVAGTPAPIGRREVLEEHGWGTADVYDRETLPAGTTLAGPVVLEEPGSTTWVATGMSCEVDARGNLIIHTGKA